jgi:O-acetyl-ADP-ribose deacetylase (regulator of RNase III)/ADP-ribosylglycohydrolase
MGVMGSTRAALPRRPSGPGGEVASPPMDGADLYDRVAGSLYGLLIGDARAKGRDGSLHAGDGQQALAMLDAILQKTHDDNVDLAHAFRRQVVELYRTGGTDGGRLGLYRGDRRSFREALIKLVEGAEPEEAASGTAGDGAAVRVAPVVLTLRQASDDELADALVESALCTHTDPRAVAAAGAIGWMVRIGMSFNGSARDLVDDELVGFCRLVEERAARARGGAPSSVFADALAKVVEHIDDDLVALGEAVVAHARTTTEEPVERADGYALVSPLLSIAVVARTATFADAIEEASLSGVHSAGALVGQVAGALYGRQDIPVRWLDRLRARGAIEDRIAAVVRPSTGFSPGFSLYELERGWTAIVDEEAAYPDDVRPAEFTTDEETLDLAGFGSSLNETMKIARDALDTDSGEELFRGNMHPTVELDMGPARRAVKKAKAPEAQLGLFERPSTPAPAKAPPPAKPAPAAVIEPPAREATHAALLLEAAAGLPDLVTIVLGDITTQQVDAIVNAANTSLLGGGGVDGAIHRAGGPSILEACQKIRSAQGGCKTGDAVITTGGSLPATWVIHAVGPRWRGGEHGEPDLLRRAYDRSLALAAEHGARTVAFPAISAGTYRYPLDAAARVALEALRDGAQAWLGAFDELRMVLFDQETFEAFQHAAHLLRTGE